MASHPIYQFYAELDDYKPKIWRRFQVSGNVTAARLGYIVQVLFEMTASHLMAIEVPVGENAQRHTTRKGEPFDADFIERYYKVNGVMRIDRYDFIDENFESYDVPYLSQKEIRDVRLYRIMDSVGDVLRVNYDFGDDWWVSLKLEKVFDDKALPGNELPRVLDGAGFGIVEDCGGTGGLEDLAKAFKKKKGAAYEQFSEWLGVDDLDMAAFDLDDMNFRMKKIPRIYKQCYEDRLTPTQRSIDLIERKYLKEKT